MPLKALMTCGLEVLQSSLLRVMLVCAMISTNRSINKGALCSIYQRQNDINCLTPMRNLDLTIGVSSLLGARPSGMLVPTHLPRQDQERSQA